MGTRLRLRRRQIFACFQNRKTIGRIYSASARKCQNGGRILSVAIGTPGRKSSKLFYDVLGTELYAV